MRLLRVQFLTDHNFNIAQAPNERLTKIKVAANQIMEGIPNRARVTKDHKEVCDLDVPDGKLIGVPYEAFRFMDDSEDMEGYEGENTDEGGDAQL